MPCSGGGRLNRCEAAELTLSFPPRPLRHAGFFDAAAELAEVGAIVSVADLLLDGAHLLPQDVVALRL